MPMAIIMRMDAVSMTTMKENAADTIMMRRHVLYAAGITMTMKGTSMTTAVKGMTMTKKSTSMTTVVKAMTITMTTKGTSMTMTVKGMTITMTTKGMTTIMRENVPVAMIIMTIITTTRMKYLPAGVWRLLSSTQKRESKAY